MVDALQYIGGGVLVVALFCLSLRGHRWAWRPAQERGSRGGLGRG
jgi:hypothetical protein